AGRPCHCHGSGAGNRVAYREAARHAGVHPSALRGRDGRAAATTSGVSQSATPVHRVSGQEDQDHPSFEGTQEETHRREPAVRTLIQKCTIFLLRTISSTSRLCSAT